MQCLTVLLGAAVRAVLMHGEAILGEFCRLLGGALQR